MKKITLICLFALSLSHIQGQLSDDFSDGNIDSSPVWIGDTDAFMVNGAYQLQLNAESEGRALLCTSQRLPDAIRWEITVGLQFATSATNKVRTYLMLDTMDQTIANGYYIEIGQNGSPDPIQFYSLENGESYLLGSSILAFEGEVSLHLTVIRDISGTWTFYADIGDGYLNEVLVINDALFQPDKHKLFCLECFFTSSRKDKFLFDNITAMNFTQDSSPPILIAVNVLDSITIELIFNENIGGIVQSENIHISPDIGNPSSMLTDHHKLHIRIGSKFKSGENYTCSTMHIPDTSYNTSGLQTKSFQFIKIATPLPGEMVLNEILFDPITDDSPFIEIYNTSDNFFNCSNIVLSIGQEHDVTNYSDMEECLISPDSFIVFTRDRLSTINHYPSNNESAILETDLLSLPRDFGSIVLRAQNGSMIDSVYYNEDFHHSLLDETRGVSLERISPTSPALNQDDWNSASAQSAWGTPGLPNSQYIRFDSVTTPFHIENQIFSPDGDGYADFLLIRFSDTEAGQIATARVYDEFGREVSVLLQNELIGSGSTSKWDGTINSQGLAPTGIYILLVEILKETGNVNSYKEAVTLAAGF